MTFSEEAWAATEGLRAAINDLPFNRELAAGTLDRDRFRFYVLQDALYLGDYARALATAAAKAPDPDAQIAFAQSAHGAIAVERTLHEEYFRLFDITPEDAAAVEASPSCAGYTGFLLTVGLTGTYEELAAAILPCFWIYWDVGTRISRNAAPDNPYRAWIDTYADEQFGRAVRTVIDLTDRAADRTTEGTRIAMHAAFRRSTQYEWMFWDSAYRMEQWPIW